MGGNMKIVVGSLNRAKITGVERAFKKYFDDIEIVSVKVDSGVPPQPVSLEDVIKGSKTRALKAGEKVDGWSYSIGVEAGLFKVGGIWMDVQVAYIVDSEYRCSIGLSPAYPVPDKVIEKLLGGEYDELEDVLNDYYNRIDIGEKEGFIGILTKNIVDRSELTYYAVIMALPPFINKELYGIS